MEDSAVKASVEVTPTELLLIGAEGGTAIVDIVALRVREVKLLDVVLDFIAEAANVKFEELEERDGSAAEVIVGTEVKAPPVGGSIGEK